MKQAHKETMRGLLMNVLLLALVAPLALASNNKVGESACGVKFDDATFSLGESTVVSLRDSRNDGYESKFRYLLGFCKNVESSDINEPYIPGKCKDVLDENGGGVAALQYLPTENDDDSGTCYAIGGHLDGSGANQSFEKLRPSDPSMGFTLKYTNGEKCSHVENNPRRSISIDHVCADRAARDDHGQVIESSSCHYTVVIETREGCPRECPIVESQGIGASRVCNAKGVCRFSTSENKPKCFCDKGYKGPRCTETGDSTPHEKSSSGGAIAGGFFGGSALGGIIGAALYYYLYVHKPKQAAKSVNEAPTSSQAPAWQGSSGYTPPDAEIAGDGGGRDPLL